MQPAQDGPVGWAGRGAGMVAIPPSPGLACQGEAGLCCAVGALPVGWCLGALPVIVWCRCQVVGGV